LIADSSKDLVQKGLLLNCGKNA